MILDQTNLFSDKQAVAAADVSTNVIDLGARGVPAPLFPGVTPVPLERDLGRGHELDILVQLMADVSTGTAPTLDVAIETSDDEAFGSGVDTIPIGQLRGIVAGSKTDVIKFPTGAAKRYIRLVYTPGGTVAATDYSITAGLVMAVDTAAA